MKRISAERVAQIGIGVAFLALIRKLSEYFGLKRFGSQPMTLTLAEPYITGASIAGSARRLQSPSSSLGSTGQRLGPCRQDHQ